jgi:protein-disulfide isomerase-like protein with CxxC motif
MKYTKMMLVALAILLGNSLFGQANAIDKYFKQYLDDERFSVVYISGRMFRLFDKFNIDEMDMDDDEAKAMLSIAKDLEGLRILTTDENVQAFYEEAKNKINTNEYEILMTIRSRGDDNVDFLIKEEGNVITELLMLVGGNDDFALLSFVGRIDLDKISELAREMEKE